MEAQRQCPPHRSVLTPNDTMCHAHLSKMQQRLHDVHCRALGCPFALRSNERYEDVPVHAPRNWVERRLYALDVLVSTRDDPKKTE